jgi:ribosomal-protein-alanine N-acetyltransferase
VSARLRPATGADLDAIVAIEQAAFSDPWSAASFTALLRAPRSDLTVAEDANRQIVGYSVLLHAGPDADLANLAVAPRARGGGVGRLLLAGVLERARTAGVARVYLEVRESNARAIALYEAAGFSSFGHRRRYYRDPVEDARVLRIELKPG